MGGSEELRKAIQQLNNLSKKLAPQIQLWKDKSIQISRMWKDAINPDIVKTLNIAKFQGSNIANLAKQLDGIFPTFQLSDEMREFIKEAKESEQLSEDEFEFKYGEEIEICKTLGANGWIVSGHSNPREISQWYNAVIADNSDAIVEFFEKDNGRVLETIISDLDKKYILPANRNYFERGIKAFRENDYMTAAMYLVALLDVRVNKLAEFPKGIRYYSQKFSDNGFAHIKKEQFEVSDSFFMKRYYFLNVYPSMIEYLSRLFVDGEYTFESGNEPPYVNRNWILHGRTSRNVERYECIQILNALDMIEGILGKDKTDKKEGKHPMTEKDKEKIISEAAKLIANLPNKSNTTTGRAVGKVCPDMVEKIEFSEFFDIHNAIVETLEQQDIILDFSSHDDKVEGLPWNLDFYVYHKALQKAQIISDMLRYFKNPLEETVVEQHLTISATGRVWFSDYVLCDGGRVIRNKKQLTIGNQKAAAILCYINDYVQSKPEPILATDVGNWDMNVTKANGSKESLFGALIGGVEIDGVDLDTFIRERIPIEDLEVFGGHIEDEEE